MEEYKYDTLASSMKIENITSCEYNQNILKQLKENDDELKFITICRDDDVFDESDYRPHDDDGAGWGGWLGYYLGQNESLQDLVF